MRRNTRARAAALALAVLLATLVGCGGGTTVGDATESTESKQANTSGQKAMEDYMKSKTQSKGKSGR